MKNKLAIVDVKIPDWVNQCNGDYLQIKHIPICDLPPLVEVNALIDQLTADKNCTYKQSIWLFEQLAYLPSAASDRRLESELLTDIISKMFMQFPLWVGKNAVINLLSKLKWLPVPVEIINELETVYQPVGITISRAKTFKLLVEKSEQGDGENSKPTSKADTGNVLYAENSFGQKIETRFEINRIVYQNKTSIKFTDLRTEMAIGEVNKKSRELGDLSYKGRLIRASQWPNVDKFLPCSSLFGRAKRLGLNEWLSSLVNAIYCKVEGREGFDVETIDLMICKSGFAQLMTAFEAEQADDAA